MATPNGPRVGRTSTTPLSTVASTPRSTPSLTQSNKEDDDEIIKELCISNGLCAGNLPQGEGNSAEVLEMFFSGYPRLVGLHHFPNVHTLIIMGQMIERIEGLTCLPKLKELWLCECRIRKIEHLEVCKQIRKLYLYNNKIKHIEKLEHLTELECLWLNSNQITNIENLSSLPKLRELNLADNEIEKIGHSLDGNQKLEDLNLSGNKISSLKDLSNLMRLPGLVSLSLKDPKDRPNPVSLLCNYSTHILYHLPKIQRLDTYEVSNKSLGELAEATVVKKKMYYNMRVRTLRRTMSDLIEKVSEFQGQLIKAPKERLRILFYAIKEIEREMQEGNGPEKQVEASDSDTESDRDAKEIQAAEEQADNSAYTRKALAIQECIKRWEKKIQEVEYFAKETCAQIHEKTNILAERLVTELESGGNIRFEDGTTADAWFSSCHDLVLSRFCAADYKEQGVVGIKINRITRIHNRMLRARFDDKLYATVEESDAEYYLGQRNTMYKKLVEYLFWQWDPEMVGGTSEPTRVLVDGFMDGNSLKSLGKDAAVPLSNSLSLADRHRIASCIKHARKKTMSDVYPFRYGQLIVCKVYLGKSTAALGEKLISQSAYPGIDSVFKPRKKCLGAKEPSESQACECSSRQCEWYLFDEDLVLPEYVIEFEYITRLKARSPFSLFNEQLLYKNPVSPAPMLPREESTVNDENVLNMAPELKPRPRLIALTDELLKKILKTDSLINVTSLNLHGNGLSKLKQLHAMPSLKKLIVSYNELTRLDDISHMGLEYVDASFNKIATLDGMKSLHKLQVLNLDWNRLQNTREDLSILRKHTPNLLELDIRNNCWQKPEGLRLRAIGRLKSLTILDGVTVSETEATSALRMAAGSRISQVSLLAHSKTDTIQPRSLSLATYAQILSITSRNKPEKFGDHDSQWYLKVTTLNLDGQHITKLSNLERLENLKWASFNDNDLTKIEGLECCSRLEEVSLENNCITKLDGLGKLSHLIRLSLAQNYVTSVDGAMLQHLTSLAYLSLENNLMTCLSGLQRLTALMELYMGNNQVASIREAYFLKPLVNFVILDLSGNPIASDVDNYRLFIIYHLKMLKALDGMAIESIESSTAKDTFGGRLTTDFIAERLGHSNFTQVRELDLPNAGIRTVDLSVREQFGNLRSVNLEHNNLTSFQGLIHLVNLRVLCLNHNHIECVVPRPKNSISKPKLPVGGLSVTGVPRPQEFMLPETFTPILESLEVLHLGYNGIHDLAGIQLSRIPSLKAVFLQGNEISRIDGLDGLHDLRELVLDRNKIKNINESSFANQWNLQELHLEENRVRELTNLHCLENLQRLYLGSNRIQEMCELEKLEGLGSMIELSLVNNPVSRRMLHRPILVLRMPQVMVIDGIPVSDEERHKAELYFVEQQAANQQTVIVEATLPGIGQYTAQIPVKVTNMQLGSPPIWGGTVYYEDSYQETAQRGGGRRRGQTKHTTESGTPLNRGTSFPPTSNQTGYGTNYPSNRAQYLSQIPSLSQQSQTAEYIENLTRYNNIKNNRR